MVKKSRNRRVEQRKLNSKYKKIAQSPHEKSYTTEQLKVYANGKKFFNMDEVGQCEEPKGLGVVTNSFICTNADMMPFYENHRRNLELKFKLASANMSFWCDPQFANQETRR